MKSRFNKAISRLKLKRLFFAAGLWLAGTTIMTAQPAPTNGVLIVYDSAGAYGWIGEMHGKMLANLLGHFDLPYKLEAVENYQAGNLKPVRATFYFGLTYDNPLPAAFTNDVMKATNTVCWFKYNLWQLSWPNPAFNSKFGFGFAGLDSSGYSNIVYKGQGFPKNQLDPELGLVTILNTNLAQTPVLAWRTNASHIGTSMPYVTHASNFWYVADSPFDYISEEDRYVAFADLLHDILGINHPEIHRAIIRIEDVSTAVYLPSYVVRVADYLHSNSVPFALATIPVSTDPLGYSTGETHHLADTNDAVAVEFLGALNYAVSNGAQIIIHGYTHQYSTNANPYSGMSAADFEFWRETFSDPTNYIVNLSRPVPEDSVAWVSNRLNAATNELHQAGLSWVAWETPHYAASALDYQVMATNFPLFMERSLYFAADYDPVTNNSHYAGQFFPYDINHDLYGRKILPENLGNISLDQFLGFATRSATDIVRAAGKNLAIRDGWANAYFHGFLDLTNLQTLVTGIRALGYTYVPLTPAGPPLHLTAGAATNTVALSFTTQFGFSYHLEYKDALTNTTWLEWTNTTGTGAPLTWNPPKAAAQRFFRLRVE